MYEFIERILSEVFQLVVIQTSFREKRNLLLLTTRATWTAAVTQKDETHTSWFTTLAPR